MSLRILIFNIYGIKYFHHQVICLICLNFPPQHYAVHLLTEREFTIKAENTFFTCTAGYQKNTVIFCGFYISSDVFLSLHPWGFPKQMCQPILAKTTL